MVKTDCFTITLSSHSHQGDKFSKRFPLLLVLNLIIFSTALNDTCKAPLISPMLTFLQSIALISVFQHLLDPFHCSCFNIVIYCFNRYNCGTRPRGSRVRLVSIFYPRPKLIRFTTYMHSLQFAYSPQDSSITIPYYMYHKFSGNLQKKPMM